MYCREAKIVWAFHADVLDALIGQQESLVAEYRGVVNDY